MPAFLLEIGLEEVPARMIAAAQAELAERIEKLLQREHLLEGAHTVRSYSTPRRLAVCVEGVQAQQPDTREELLGPSLKVAYKDGAPTPAAIAFAKKAGVDVSALQTVTNAKGEYIGATVERKGRPAADVLAEALPREIAALYWAKNMYWRAGKPERFVRPLRWLLALLDSEVVPVEFAGIRADGVSYGHRVLHGEAPVVIAQPADYAAKLEAAKVIVDAEARRQRIRKALDAAARTVVGARWREDEELVETVTHLTEWPTVLLGSFEQEHLTLPEEILVTVMRDHQKYFALEDASGKLLPNFLAVLNTEVNAEGAAIILHGNARVLRARFNDARFFWDVDQKIPLIDRVEMLKHVTFHKDLGSYWDKTERNKITAKYLLDPRREDAGELLQKTIDLAKTDLTTDMVKEFTELQGVVGGLYAKAQGLPQEAAQAIYEHYRPMGSSDAIPVTALGAYLALSDKMTTITEMFHKGLVPTGSKDPFALRRAGAGVVRILAENEHVQKKLQLVKVIHATNQYDERDENLRSQVLDFMLDRLEFYLQESCSVSLQAARAVRNSGAATCDDDQTGYGYVAGFAKALHAAAGSPQVLAVAELLKRASNILRQAKEKGIPHEKHEDGNLFQDAAEKELARQVAGVQMTIQANYRAGKYNEVITAVAGLQPALNAFFDSVMVMVDDQNVRANRLALLAHTVSVVRWAADFSELASI